MSKTAARGLDRAHIILGCLQPGQTSSVYTDALSRLSDRLHYLDTSGDRSQESGRHARFWFDTRANLRPEMEDRKRRFDDKRKCAARSPMFSRRPLSIFAGCSYPLVNQNK
jgi:uncharacterized protein